MNWKILWTLLLAVSLIWQVILAVSAERSGNFDKAIYEMLWLFFFLYLVHEDRK